MTSALGSLAAQDAPASSPRGAELYARYCVTCHGVTGAGDGPAAHVLSPLPRDFRAALFSLTSTMNGMPTDADLVATLRRGMPGSSMPSWDWLPADDLAALARHVRGLAVDGVATSLREDARNRGRRLGTPEARTRAAAVVAPGTPVPTLPPAPTDDGGTHAERGRVLYLEACAACHGTDGRGRPRRGPFRQVADHRWARDFTQGILRGETTRQALAHRILTGLPASGMPPTHFDEADLAAVADYVRSLIPEGASDRLVQRRQRIHAARRDELPTDGNDPSWAPGTIELALAPLAWDDAAVTHVRVAALHDGTDLAIRLSWADPTRNGRAIDADGPAAGADAAAVQFSDTEAPPPGAMGRPDQPVNVWHWQAFRRADLIGAADLLAPPPHGGLRTDATPAIAAPGLTAPAQEGRSAETTGFRSVRTARDDGTTIRTDARWSDGRWTVVFRRSLAARADRELPLKAGQRLEIGFAVWNGAVETPLHGKATTIWHRLILDD